MISTAWGSLIHKVIVALSQTLTVCASTSHTRNDCPAQARTEPQRDGAQVVIAAWDESIAVTERVLHAQEPLWKVADNICTALCCYAVGVAITCGASLLLWHTVATRAQEERERRERVTGLERWVPVQATLQDTKVGSCPPPASSFDTPPYGPRLQSGAPGPIAAPSETGRADMCITQTYKYTWQGAERCITATSCSEPCPSGSAYIAEDPEQQATVIVSHMAAPDREAGRN